MSRRREAPKRVILPDPKYKSLVLAKFINVVMKNGKKSVAEKVVYGALDALVQEIKKAKKQTDTASSSDTDTGYTTLQYFEQALDNVKPSVEVRSRRVGGATYQVPVEVRSDRSTALAMRWITKAARDRGEQGMILRLTGELRDAFNHRGGAFKKKDDTHKMANANKAFANLIKWNN